MEQNRERIVGLQEPSACYGLKPIPYIRPSRYYLGTSSSRTFRRCLRKWGFQSSYKLGLQGKGTEQNINFWFGSAIHFAMEDYFGYNKFGDPRRAFKAYYDAFDISERPENAAEYYDLGIGMLDYFMEWYPKHNASKNFKTAWLLAEEGKYTRYTIVPENTPNAFPAVEFELCLDMGKRILVDAETGDILAEVLLSGKLIKQRDWLIAEHVDNLAEVVDNFEKFFDSEDWDKVEIPFNGSAATQTGTFDFSGKQNKHKAFVQPIYWHGTVDKIVIDDEGKLWITDYKTAASADVNKLDTDDQISRYMWAAEQILQMPIYGFCYLQLTKAAPKEPRILKNGGVSSDKRQKTTHSLYRKALIDVYGSVEQAPAANIQCLNTLAENETPEGDSFIRWDLVTRSAEEKEATYYHIIAEADRMIDPDLYCYPTQTRDCAWDCPFKAACLALDRNDTGEFKLALDNYEPRKAERSDEEPTWRDKIIYPDSVPVGVPTDAELQIDRRELNIILPQIEEEM